jgi:PilZ domain-containing protein
VSLRVARGRRFPTSGGSLTIDFEVRDLSVGGLLLETDQRVGLGDGIEFALPLQDGDDPLALRARIQRVQQGAIGEAGTWYAGCKFEGLRAGEQARIAGFIAANRHLASSDAA